jgi:pimeloyl-ACP methyl ester carboxylesterase
MPTTAHVPLILIRGFGGLNVDDERQVAYQGFNEGTVYPQKRGENYIYEGLILKYLKSLWHYHDATNVVGYYRQPIIDERELPDDLKVLDPGYFTGHSVVIDAGTALDLISTNEDPRRSLWVFRYYDLDARSFPVYGSALVRLIDFIRDLTVLKTGQPRPLVNIIAHSMGGLVVREALQRTLPGLGRKGADCINKIVTLGTPHQGVSFQIIRDWKFIDADEELERFNPDAQKDPANPWSYVNFGQHFPPERVLTVVGTNYKSYSARAATGFNRLFSTPQEFGWNYNRSDGLVKQSSAQLPGAPRTFVHKCHGGYDSLVTSRESFEISTRFFHGDIYVRVNLLEAEVKRGFDFFGKSEMFFGMSVKPRRVDFELFHQSAEAENCYGPFRTADFSDALAARDGFGWAGPDRLIWEGWFDTSRITPAGVQRIGEAERRDLVMRFDFYVGERDLLGVGFSDNVIFRKQYYIRAVAGGQQSLTATLEDMELYLYADEDFGDTANAAKLERANGQWTFVIEGTGFKGRLGISVTQLPEAS